MAIARADPMTAALPPRSGGRSDGGKAQGWQMRRWGGMGALDPLQCMSGRIDDSASKEHGRAKRAAYRVRVCGFFWILFSFGFLFLRAGMPLTRINGDFHIPFGACGLALPHAKTPFGPHGKNLFCSSEPWGLGFN